MIAETVPFFAFRDFPGGMDQEIKAALSDALERRQYILGEHVNTFETAFAEEVGADFALGVGNGLDALTIALKAAGVSAGDEVILPANTFIATANAVVLAGGKPVFAEPDLHTYNLKAEAIAAKVTSRTKAIIPVHLYGQSCEMEDILDLAADIGLKVIEDAAQAHGATYKGKAVGALGYAGAFSFYPTKNLGALGDAGAIVTCDALVAEFVRKFRNYGEQQKYHNEVVGVNSRLDTIQAAVLHVKLKHLQKLNTERHRLANVYLTELSGISGLVLPVTAAACGHVYHIFNIRTRERDQLKQHLKESGVHTAVHYPVPVHLQPAYSFVGCRAGDFPIAEKLADSNLSLPLFPGLTESEQGSVIDAVKAFFR